MSPEKYDFDENIENSMGGVVIMGGGILYSCDGN